jgi:hypothetical protein
LVFHFFPFPPTCFLYVPRFPDFHDNLYCSMPVQVRLFLNPEDRGNMSLRSIIIFQKTTWFYNPEDRSLESYYTV